MDIYDGLTGEPVVYHGNTLTSKVSVRDICHAIAKYAFVTSPYPVVISAEIHCNIKQQDKMVYRTISSVPQNSFFPDEAFLLQVHAMVEIFGDALIRAPEGGTTLKIDTLPSPEDLKGKILLKVTYSILGFNFDPYA